MKGLKYHPNLVLLGFNLGTDLIDNSHELARKRDGEESVKFMSRPFLLAGPENEWNVTSVNYESARISYEQALRQLEQATRLEKTSLYQLYKPLRLRWKTSESADPKWELHMIGLHACHETESYHSAWTITRRILAKLKQDVNAADSELIVFTVPSVFEADPVCIRKNKNTRDKAKDF
jgi:hypothetical protein